MADYYKLVGHQDSTTNWTTEVVLEVNDQGEPTKVVRAGEPSQISASDRDKLESMGFVLESSTKAEAEEAGQTQAPGSDIAGAAPAFEADEEPDEDTENESGSRKRSRK